MQTTLSRGFSFDSVFWSEHPQMLAKLLSNILPSFQILSSNTYPESACVRCGGVHITIPKNEDKGGIIRLTVKDVSQITPEVLKGLFDNLEFLRQCSFDWGKVEAGRPLQLTITCSEGSEDCAFAHLQFEPEGQV